jgi:hypothetical protein
MKYFVFTDVRTFRVYEWLAQECHRIDVKRMVDMAQSEAASAIGHPILDIPGSDPAAFTIGSLQRQVEKFIHDMVHIHFPGLDSHDERFGVFDDAVLSFLDSIDYAELAEAVFLGVDPKEQTK